MTETGALRWMYVHASFLDEQHLYLYMQGVPKKVKPFQLI